MIGKFLTSKFSGYMAIAGIIGILALLGALKLYGASEYQKGYDKAIAEHNLAENKTLKNDATIWNEVRHENSKITDIDGAAAKLGVLRPDSQR